MNYLIILVGILSMFFLKPEGDVYWPQWMFLVLMVIATITYRLKSSPLSLRLLFLYVTTQAALFAFHRPLTQELNTQGQFVIRYVSLVSIAYVVFPAIFFSRWRSVRKPVAIALFIGGLVHSLSLIWDQVIMGYKTGEAYLGLLGNRSIGATFVAIWVFFCLRFAQDFGKKDWKNSIKYCSIIGVIAVLVSNSSISFAALCAGLYALYFVKEQNIRNRVQVLCLSIVLGSVVGYFAAPRMLNSDQSRYEGWKLFYRYWDANFNWWTGSGGGTFAAYGPTAQTQAQWHMTSYFLWAHSDWIQILLEYGRIGLFLTLWFSFDVFKKAKNKPLLFAGLVAAAVTMCGNYPMENALCSLLLWWMVAEAISEKKI